MIERMPLGLARHRLGDRRVEQRIVVAGPQRRAQIGIGIVAQAQEQPPGTIEPYPVAPAAEIMRQRGDEPDHPALACPHIARRPPGRPHHVGQRPPLGEPRAHLRQRQILVDPLRLDRSQRHHLDHAQLGPARMRPFGEHHEMIAIVVAQRHRVELDRDPRRNRRIDRIAHDFRHFSA